MSDTLDKRQRSELMSKVKCKNNKSTELRLIKIMKEMEIKGWRRGYPIKGHPDFVFIKQRLAVFVDGCFWHGHNCRNLSPDDNKTFWENKISSNREHDLKVTSRLEARKWKVVRIWECELTNRNKDIAKMKLCDALNVPSI